MKQVKVNPYQVGLVFKDGAYRRMLREGKYWLWNEDVQLYDTTMPFNPSVELNILLQDNQLADALEIVEVKDTEIALMYQDGLLKQILTAGRHAYWKSVMQYRFVKIDNSTPFISADIERSTLQNPLLTAWVRNAVVESYEKAILLIDGRYTQMLEPGVHYWWKNKTVLNVAKVDTRQQQLEINGQEILTKDKAAIRVNAWAQFVVTDIEKALLQNKEYDKQLYVAAQLALRGYISGYSLDELLDKKEALAPAILARLQAEAAKLGVQVNGLDIRDIVLPGDVKDIMSQVLVAEKKAQANIIMRREETASTRSLLNTAKLMEDNAMLWKLKEMEYVEKIADKISNISVSSNGALIEQLRGLFAPANK